VVDVVGPGWMWVPESDVLGKIGVVVSGNSDGRGCTGEAAKYVNLVKDRWILSVFDLASFCCGAVDLAG